VTPAEDLRHRAIQAVSESDDCWTVAAERVLQLAFDEAQLGILNLPSHKLSGSCDWLCRNDVLMMLADLAKGEGA
jgi:hypothetical protein